MSKSLNEISVDTLKGVGQALQKKLGRLGITTIQDLLFHLPFRYEDRTQLTPISAAQPSGSYVFEGEIVACDVTYGRRRSLLAYLEDPSGRIGLRFFHFSKAQHQNLKNAGKIRCFGEVRSGASGPGANATNNPNGGGQGGAGRSITIGGQTATYGGGGGGCGESPQGTLNNGGAGGGGRGAGNSGSVTDRDGSDGLGGGGGGVRDPGNRAGHGGNGRIIIAYAGGQRGSGGSYTSSGGWSYHTYNYTGSLTTYTA